MDLSLRKILRDIGHTAATAADEGKKVIGKTGKAVSDKADIAKSSLQLLNLRADQEDIFAEIGKTIYLLHSGAMPNDVDAEGGSETEATINRLLIKAAEKQSEMDYYTEKLAQLKGQRTCPVCGKKCRDDDIFCAGCGKKLKADE